MTTATAHNKMARADNETAHGDNTVALPADRYEDLWDLVLNLRCAAVTRGDDPYTDPTARKLTTILTGTGGHTITHGTHREWRCDLETAKARAEHLFADVLPEEHELEWRTGITRDPDGLALAALRDDDAILGPIVIPATGENRS